MRVGLPERERTGLVLLLLFLHFDGERRTWNVGEENIEHKAQKLVPPDCPAQAPGLFSLLTHTTEASMLEWQILGSVICAYFCIADYMKNV